MKEKTLLHKTVLGLVSGIASLSIASCTTPGPSSDSSAPMGKCYGVKCGSCGGSCKGKDKKAGCGKDCGGEHKGHHKDKKAGCGKDCGGEHKGHHKDKKGSCGGSDPDGTKYKMMTQKACENKGGTWKAE